MNRGTDLSASRGELQSDSRISSSRFQGNRLAKIDGVSPKRVWQYQAPIKMGEEEMVLRVRALSQRSLVRMEVQF